MGNLAGAANAALSKFLGWIDAAAGNPLIAKIAFATLFLLVAALLARAALARMREADSGSRRAFARADSRASSPEMDDGQVEELTLVGTIANALFLQFETIAYIVLAVLLAGTVILGIVASAGAVMGSALTHLSDENTLVYTVDRLLFVLMVVEILRTVRDSFRSGRLVSEPFLIVGLIATIRRVLVITLESSQASRAGGWTAATQGQFGASMLELIVLAVLILVMVVSIFLLRMSRRYRH